MPPESARNPWQRLRRLLRWCRIALLVLVALLLLGGFYLHQVGVPGPVRDLVLASLRSHGVTLAIGRLRLHWYRGLVADRVALEIGPGPELTQVSCDQVILHLDWRALRRGQVEIRGLELRDGQVTLPLAATNQPAEELVLDRIATRLRWNGDTWDLDELTARVLGASLRAHGTLTNGSALWRPRRAAAAGAPPAGQELRERVRQIKRIAAAFTFDDSPELLIRFSGDAAQPATWTAEVQARTVAADTPWGRMQDLQVQARLLNAVSNGLAVADLRAGIGGLTSRWGNLQSARLRALVSRPWGQPAASRLDWQFDVAEVTRPGSRLRDLRLQGHSTPQESPAGSWSSTIEAGTGPLQAPGPVQVGHLGLRGRFTHAMALAWPRAMDLHLVIEDGAYAGFQTAQALVDLSVRRPDPPPEPSADAGPGRMLAPFEAGFTLRADQVVSPQLALSNIFAAGGWAYPALTLSNVQARLLDGTVQITRARLDTVTREVAAEVAVDFDVQKLERALPAAALKWLAQFEYDQPPHAVALARVRLPPWGTRPERPGPELLSTLDLQVRLDGQNAGYRGLRCDAAGVTLSISNQILRLRDLTVLRPEGRASLSYDLDLRRRDFRWRVDSALDPQAAAPAVDPGTLAPIVRLFGFTTPPRVTGEIWGNWNPPRPLGLALQIGVTNFSFRGEAFDSLNAGLQKTNEFISGSAVRITRGEEWAGVPWVTFDLTNRVVALTNARSRMDPQLIARCIGSNVVALLDPYRFASPPEVTSDGQIPVGGDLKGASMNFEVEGGPFRFWRFQLPHLTTGVRWRGDRVSITNVAASFYDGRISGGIDLEMLGDGDALFRFQALATDFDLAPLLRDVHPSTNRMEGRATVSIIVTDAHTLDWGSWYGRGEAEMRNGLIWDLPVFGVFSTVMNVVIPGLGNSRASAAKATYRIYKSVIHTEDLAIAAGPARLQYKGSVDFDGRIEARVMAEVLHGTPLIGPLISLVLSPAAKVMEFKVTGTIGAPVIKPLHVPGFLLPLFNPLGTLQNLLGPAIKPAEPGPAPASTAAPAPAPGANDPVPAPAPAPVPVP